MVNAVPEDVLGPELCDCSQQRGAVEQLNRSLCRTTAVRTSSRSRGLGIAGPAQGALGTAGILPDARASVGAGTGGGLRAGDRHRRAVGIDFESLPDWEYARDGKDDEGTVEVAKALVVRQIRRSCAHRATPLSGVAPGGERSPATSPENPARSRLRANPGFWGHTYRRVATADCRILQHCGYEQSHCTGVQLLLEHQTW